MNKMKSFLWGLMMFALVVVGIGLWLSMPWFVVVGFVVLFAVWMATTRRGRQAASVAQVGISTIKERIGSSSVIVIGIAGVVAVLVAMFAMAEGYRETLARSGSPDTAIVLRGASALEVMSTLERESLNAITGTAGIARDAQGRPIASAEIVVAANLPIKGGGPDEDGSV